MEALSFANWLGIQEMALRKMELVPPHNPEDPKSAWGQKARKYGWDDTDRKLLTSTGGVNKFTSLWANTEHEFDMYMVRSKNANKFREIGEVDQDWIRQNLPEMKDFQPAEDAITIIFTNNTGADKVHFSAWTAAHRFGHALSRRKGGSLGVSTWYAFEQNLQSKLESILQNYFGVKPGRAFYGSKFPDQKTQTLLARLATGIGTMRSTRQNNLRNYVEFECEVLAQYLVTKNKVQFQTELGRMLVTKYAWGKPSAGAYMKRDINKEDLVDAIEEIADYCNYQLNDVMSEAVGRIFVM